MGSEPGYLYGYYPYKSGTKEQPINVRAIPVASSLNGDDVMYAEKQTAITDVTASKTEITMNHALARVSLKVINKGYTGDAKLSQIKFSAAGIAPAGTLNAIDGSITVTKSDDVSFNVTGDARAITAAGTTYECLLVPSKVETNKQAVTLTLTIDGNTKTATFSGDNGVIIAQGTRSNITITLSNSGIAIQSVSVDDWNVVEVSGHKVTIAVAEGIDPNDILTRAYVDGDNVIIKASSETGYHLKCTLPSGEFCPQSNTDNLFYTFTLSNIESDITATVEYAKPITLNFSSSNNSDWGTAIIAGDCYEGHKISFTATVKGSKCRFAGWQNKDEITLSENNPYEIILTSDLTVKAVFKAPEGVLSVSNNGGQTTKQILFSPGCRTTL